MRAGVVSCEDGVESSEVGEELEATQSWGMKLRKEKRDKS